MQGPCLADVDGRKGAFGGGGGRYGLGLDALGHFELQAGGVVCHV